MEELKNVAEEKELKVEDPAVCPEKEEEGNYKPDRFHILPIIDSI